MPQLSRVASLMFLAMLLLLISGCSPAVRGEETTTATLVDSIPSVVDASASPLTKAAEPATPTTRPTLPATNTPLATLDLNDGSTEALPAELTVSPTPTTTMVTSGTNPMQADPTVVALTPELPLAIDPAFVNGIPVSEIIVVTDEVAANIRTIYARGKALGRNGQAFSKLGDSLIATPSFMTQFDAGQYDLGAYAHLQPVIDYFGGSFERYGVALRPGLHAWGVFDPLWANKDWCLANEDLLNCEVRLNNPGVLLILLGTNDAGNPPGFDYNMRKVVVFAIENGIIPIIVTKADRFEGPENINNDILRQIATDFQVPLWDFDLVAGTLPGRGLTDDQVHLTVFPENDYTLPEAYQTGHGLHNLTGLMALEAVRQAITR